MISGGCIRILFRWGSLALAVIVVACNADNNASDSVSSASTPVPFVTLSASPGTLFSGQASRLQWDSSAVDRCTATEFYAGDLPIGEALVRPDASTTYSISCAGVDDDKQYADHATVFVSSDASPSFSLEQAAIQPDTGDFVFGFNSISRIPIAGAPADTDFTRMAMLHDGSDYQLYALVAGSTSDLYRFVYDAATRQYVHDGTSSTSSLSISGLSDSAEPISIAMLHDRSDQLLFVRSAIDQNTLKRFALDVSTNTFEPTRAQGPTVRIANAPTHTDVTRWAVLHDGETTRLYQGSKIDSTRLYSFDLDASMNTYFYDPDRDAELVGTPASSTTDDFVMLHDGSASRFYYLAHDDLPSTDPGDLSVFMQSAYACLVRDDTSHVLFHGCIDWHSAVHAHWAVLRYGNTAGRSAEVEATLTRLRSNLLASEHQLMLDSPAFEMPYGRAWFLALALEYRELVNDDELDAMAADVADSLRTFLSSQPVTPGTREYQNPTWALIQMLRYYRFTDDTDGIAWVSRQIEDHYLEYDSSLSLELDHSRPDFFSLWGNWAMLLGLYDEEALRTWLAQQTIPDAALQPLASASSSHQLGMNPSRTWGLWWASSVSNDPRFETSLNVHLGQIVATHQQRRNDYGAYGHWVPQFVMYANTQPIR